MSRRLRLAALYIAAVIAGLAATWGFLRSPLLGQSLRVGAWTTSLVSGSTQADLYTRAKIARMALLALSREETLYFLADHDDRGQALRSRCRYRVVGMPPDARWWSVTAYADDYFLFADDAHRYSLAGAAARLDAAGRFELFTGGAAAPDGGAAWLPTPGDRGLVLVLRLYNPGAALAAEPARLAPPSIAAVGDCT
jgi:hypothetical protein